MKKLNYIIILAAAVFCLSSCDERIEIEKVEIQKKGAIPVVEFGDSENFDLSGSNQIDFVVSMNGTAESVKVYANYNGSDFVEVMTINSFPEDVVITLEEISSKLDLNLDQMEEGDVFLFKFDSISGGEVYKTQTSISAAVVE